TILFTMMLSLIGGVGFVWLLDRLDDSIRNIDDVTRFTQLPALAVIPLMESNISLLPYGRRRRKPQSVANENGLEATEFRKRARLMEFDGQSSAAESYRALRTGLLLSSADKTPKTILLTSVRSHEGKTTTSTNIAISLAQLGSSVLLIDCDLRRPSVHKAFG